MVSPTKGDSGFNSAGECIFLKFSRGRGTVDETPIVHRLKYGCPLNITLEVIKYIFLHIWTWTYHFRRIVKSCLLFLFSAISTSVGDLMPGSKYFEPNFIFEIMFLAIHALLIYPWMDGEDADSYLSREYICA